MEYKETSTDLTVRYAVQDDIATVSRFWSALIKELQFSVSDKKVHKKLETLLVDRSAYINLCEYGGFPVGTATLYISGNGPEKHAWMRRLITDADYRRKGVASRLIKNLLQTAQNEGCSKVYLECKPELVPFYNRFSFKIDHQSSDGYVMRLLLN